MFPFLKTNIIDYVFIEYEFDQKISYNHN